MKKMYLFAIVFLSVTAAMFGFSKLASAYGFHSGESATINQAKPVYDTLYLAGQTVDVNSEVYGDVFCAGQNVTISGMVHGDVLCAGQTITVTGVVDGDVRLVGQTVTLGAKVAGNATIGAQSFVLQSTGSVGGDITLGSTDATLNGAIGRDVVAGNNQLMIASTVGRDVVAGSELMSLGPNARIGGNVNLTSDKDLARDPGAVVAGKVSRTVPVREDTGSKGAELLGIGIFWAFVWILALLITAMALVLLFPRAFQSISNRALPRPWKALLTGFLAAGLVPLGIVLLAVTVVGLPLAFMLGIAWAGILFLSGPVFGYYLGRLVLRGSTRPLLIMLVGGSLLLFLYMIPVVGVLAMLAVLWIGSGMVLLEAFARTPKPVYSFSTKSAKK